MLWIWPATWIVIARRELLLQLGDDLVDLGGDAAEIAALDAGIDLVDRLDVGLIAVGRQAVALEGGDVAEQAGDRIAIRRDCRRDRRVA